MDNGETCESDADCIEGARCMKGPGGNSTRCDCEPHSVLSGNKQRCLTEARELGDKCAESIQCSQTLGGAECSLMDHTCRCRPNFHFAPSTKRCIKNKGEFDTPLPLSKFTFVFAPVLTRDSI